MYDRYGHRPDNNYLSKGNASYVYNNSITYTPKDNSRMNQQGVGRARLTDYGPEPFVVNIEHMTKFNDTFRTALWTGRHLQLTLMSINAGEDIGLEIHPELDQFVRIEEGRGIVKMGNRKDDLSFQEDVVADFAFVIPAGKWHNLINTGKTPLKLYSIYAPVQHPHGTVHVTKAEAEAAEHHMGY